MKATAAVVDSAANLVANLTALQAMSVAGKISSTTISGLTNSATAAQALALSGLAHLSLSTGAKLNIYGTAVQLLADLGTVAFAKATSIEVTAIAPPGLPTDNTVSAASAQALAAHAGFMIDPGASLVVLDTAANLLNTANGTGIAKASAEVVSGTANVVTANQAQTLAKRGATLAAGATLQVTDVAANLLNAAYAGGLSLATQVVLGSSATLTVAQAVHLMEFKGFALAGGVSLTIADTAVNILNLNGAITDSTNLSALFGTGAVHATVVSVTGYNVLSASQANTLAKIGGLVLASGAKLVVSDSAQTLLSGSAMPAEKIATQVTLGTSATVSAQQANVLGGLAAFGLASGVVLTVADSAANLLYEQGSAGLAKASVVTVTGNNSLTAARAATLAAIPHVSVAPGATLVVSDSVANLLASANYHGTHLATSIVVISNNTVSYSQLQQLSALPQVSLQAGAHITVSDNAGTLASALNALNSSPLASLVTAIMVGGTSTATPTLALTYSQYVNDRSALAKFTGAYAFTVSGVPASAAAALQADSHVSGFLVVDTSANVLSVGNSLTSSAKVISVTLTDTTNGTASISLTGAQYAADYAELSRITTPIELTITNALAAQANQLDNDKRVTGFTVTDSGAQIASNLGALEVGYDAAKLTAINVNTGPGTTLPLTITASQYDMDQHVLTALNLTNPLQLTVTGIGLADLGAVYGVGSGTADMLQDTRVAAFTFSDSLTNVLASLDTLEMAAQSGYLSDTTITGGTSATVIPVTGTQWANDALVLAELQTHGYQVSVTGATVAQAAALQANPDIASFTISDTAENIGGTAFDTLIGNAKLTAITITDGNPLALTATQYANDGAALALIQGIYILSVSNASAAQAALFQNDSRVVSYTVSDSASQISANLDALEAAYAAGSLTAITDTSSTSVSSGTNFSYDTSVFSRDSIGYFDKFVAQSILVQNNITIPTNNTILNFSIPTGLKVDLSALDDEGQLFFGQTTAPNWVVLGASLGLSVHAIIQLENAFATYNAGSYQFYSPGPNSNSIVYLYNNPTVIVNQLTITSTQYNLDGDILNLLAETGQLSLTITAAAVSDIPALLIDSRIVAIAVADTTNAIITNITTLSALTELTAVQITDTATITATQAAMLASLPGVSLGIGAMLTVADSSANVAANIDALNTLATEHALSGITLTDNNALSITGTQYGTDGAALALIAGTYTLSVSGATASEAAALNLDSHVASYTVTDLGYRISASLDALETGFDQGKLSAITISNVTTVQPASTFYYNPGWYGYDPNSDVDSVIVSDALINIGINPNTQFLAFTVDNGLSINLADISSDIQHAYGSDPNAAVNFYWIGQELGLSTYGLNQLETDYAAYLAGTGGPDALINNVPPISATTLVITAAQYANDQNVLNLLGNTYSITLQIQDVAVSDVSAYANDSRVQVVYIADTAANVAANLDQLNTNYAIGNIAITDGGVLSISYRQSIVDTYILNRTSGYSSIAVIEPTLSGTATRSTLDGTAGYQIVAAGSSGDTLLGGAYDTLIGGAGSDVFVFNAQGATGIGRETVTNFDVAHDIVQFTGGATFGGFNDFAHLLANTAQAGSDLVITDDQGDTVTLKNVNLSAFAHGVMAPITFTF